MILGGLKRASSYHEERIASSRRCNTECPPLRPLEGSQGPGCAPKDEGCQLRGHCEFWGGDGGAVGGCWRLKLSDESRYFGQWAGDNSKLHD